MTQTNQARSFKFVMALVQPRTCYFFLSAGSATFGGRAKLNETRQTGTSEFEVLNRRLVEHNNEPKNCTLRREMGVKCLKNGFDCTTTLGGDVLQTTTTTVGWVDSYFDGFS